MAEFKYTYGWKKDNPDMRDLRFTYRYPEALPDNVDLRKYTLKIYDQGPLGSCTANAGGALFEMIRTINDLPTYSPSRLYIYYNTRAYEGTIPYDAGAGIRSAIKSLSEEGCPKEESWPYEVEKFTMMPPDTVYKEGRKHVIWKYKRINNQYLTDIQHALSLGYPVVAGFSVYESFEDPIVAATGYMNMPKPYEQMKGGHAVLIVGYQNETQRFIVRNSWGEKWGEKGYFYAPYAYFTNPYLAGDFWTAVLAS